MRKVILESPYAGDIERNTAYARECLRDSLMRGESPLASHLLYTQPGVLREEVLVERVKGIMAGLEWLDVAEAMVQYCDLGQSSGMKQAEAEAKRIGIPIEYRYIYKPTEETNHGKQITINSDENSAICTNQRAVVGG